MVQGDAKRKADLILSWLKLEPDLAFEYTSWDEPEVRARILHSLDPQSLKPQLLVDQLTGQLNPGSRGGLMGGRLWSLQTLILALGAYPKDALPEPIRQSTCKQLLRGYRDWGGSEVHSAADWLLRRWGYQQELEFVDQELASIRPLKNRGWFVTAQRHTFAELLHYSRFQMGSPTSEIGRRENEDLHFQPVTLSSFALATKEVTVGQFERFVQANPGIARMPAGANPAQPERPISGITWYEAVQYCRWLSELEGIPESQMCYPPLYKIKEGMMLPPDCLSRFGYRLPTEAEWEFATRIAAGNSFGQQSSSRSYGSSEELLKDYGWYRSNANGESRPVGGLFPDQLGLFDMYGNALEWCHDRLLPYPQQAQQDSGDVRQPQIVADKAEIVGAVDGVAVVDNHARVLRGGSADSPSAELRSAFRTGQPPSSRPKLAGFRIARTIMP
jgi:formylglycine-generating enzyme required for sulfatase activity